MTRYVITVLSASLVTAIAMHAVGVFGASATTSGHFTTANRQTWLDIAESTETAHKTTLTAFGSTISCHNAHYKAPDVIVGTATGVTVTAEYTNCTTGSGGAATVRMNGCDFSFTSRTEGHGTIHFACPAGKKAEVETGVGTMKFGSQTPKGGAFYTTTEANGVHGLTVDITTEGIVAECHGACQIVGTNTTTAKLTGAAVVTATEVAEPFVGITAT
jgi:hypothetical protein